MWTKDTPFAPPPTDKVALESGATLSPRFGSDGLVTVVVVADETNEVLMLAHMNAEALALTLETRDAWYWSRSRKALWRKGETSGNSQRVVELRVDCDQDALLLRVRQQGPACHTGSRSCFYRAVEMRDEGPVLVRDGPTRND
jgi:phosphoribosyl-AMP cyclohydrolase